MGESSHKVEHGGSSPSIRDIMDGCRLRSTSTVHYHLGKLSGEGRIRLSGGGQSRGIVVPGGQWIPPREAARFMGELTTVDAIEIRLGDEVER